MQESYGYSVLDLGNPASPNALAYRDNRFGSDKITTGGDGQSDVYSLGVSDDGQRFATSLGGPGDGWYTITGGASGQAFVNQGSFAPKRAQSTLVQHVGTRYLAWTISSTQVAVADITTMPPAPFASRNMTSENTGWPGGSSGVLAGDFIVYRASTGIRIVDASSPGPVGSIATALPSVTITSAELAGTISGATAAFDAGADKLWVLVELYPAAGQSSPSYQIVTVSSALAKVVGAAWRVPALAGETWTTVGVSSALVPSGGNVWVLAWAKRIAPSVAFRLYSGTVAAWPAMPGAFDVGAAGFALPNQTAGFGTGTSVWMYVPSTGSAWALSLRCQ